MFKNAFPQHCVNNNLYYRRGPGKPNTTAIKIIQPPLKISLLFNIFQLSTVGNKSYKNNVARNN